MKMPWQQCVNWFWRFRYLLLLVAGGVTALALGPLLTLGVSNSLDMWYPGDDPALLQYEEFQKQFGSDEIVVIAISSEEGFDSKQGLAQIAELTDHLFYVDGVASVTSLSTVPESLRDARDRLLSDDGKTSALLVQMTASPELETRRHAIIVDIKEAVRNYPLSARFAGYGVIYDSLNQVSTVDSVSLLVTAHLVMILMLGLFFRRIGPVIVTLLAVGVATIWTMGLYAALGQQINMVTMALPTLVLVIGVADCVHMLRSVARQPKHMDRPTRVTTGIAAVIGPCLLTSVTTATGFFALTFSDLPVVQNLGLFGAVGMLSAFIASLIVVVASLSSESAEPRLAETFLDSTAKRLWALGDQSPKRVVAAFVFLSAIAVAGLARLETDTFSIGYLAENHPTRLDSEFIEAQIGSYAPIDYIIRAEDVLANDVLDSLQDWQIAVGNIESIDWSWSLLDALGVENNLAPSTLEPGRIRGELARLQLLAPDVADSMIAGQRELRVTFAAPMASARSVQALLAKIEARAHFPHSVTVHAAGYASLYTRIVERLVTSQIVGFSVAFGLILLSIAIATRSPIRTSLAIPANLFPVAATLGLMGWTGIPLDVATATIATVIMGLIVDDTVHILRPASQAGDDVAMTINHAVRRSGSSLLMTSLILCAGFLVMGIAEIRSIAWFGLLTSFAMATAVLTDLILLPALARIARECARQRDLARESRLQTD